MSGQINAFEMAQKQFDAVAKQLKLDAGVSEVLRWPMREYSFRIPVRLDDGSLKVFQGIMLVQDRIFDRTPPTAVTRRRRHGGTGR